MGGQSRDLGSHKGAAGRCRRNDSRCLSGRNRSIDTGRGVVTDGGEPIHGGGIATKLRRLGRYDVLALAAAIWFLAKFLRYAFPPLFDSFQASYGVSNAAVGTAFTGFMLVYAAMQFPSGALADRLGPVRVVVGGVVCAAIGAVAVTIGSLWGAVASFAMLVVTMLVMGGGTGAHKTAAIRLLAQVYPARTGRALGIFDTIGTYGGVVAPIIVIVFTTGRLSGLPGDSWRWLFLVAGIVGFVMAAAFYIRVPRRLSTDETSGTGRADRTERSQAAHNPSPHSDSTTDPNGDLKEDSTSDPNGDLKGDSSNGSNGGLKGTANPQSDGKSATEETRGNANGPGIRGYAVLFLDRRLTAFVIVTLAFSFAYNGLVAFLPLYLSREAGLAPSTASGLYGLLFLVSVVQLFSGDVSDRAGQLPVIVAALGVGTVGIGALVLLPGTTGAGTLVAFAIAVGIAGIGMHGFRPVRGSYLMRVLPDEIAGGALGVVRTGLMGAGAVAPAIIGVISDGPGFRPAFGLLAIAMAVALIIATGLWATEPVPGPDR